MVGRANLLQSFTAVALALTGSACGPAAKPGPESTPDAARVAPPPAATATAARVELASAHDATCARFDTGRVVCWSAHDLATPKEVAARGIDAIAVAGLRLWLKKGKDWSSQRIEAASWARPPIGPLPNGTHQLTTGRVSCERNDTTVSCAHAPPKGSQDPPARRELPEAAAAATLLMTRFGLCGHFQDGRVLCWTAEGDAVQVAADVRALGGPRLCLHHEDSRVTCARDDATLAQPSWDLIGRYEALEELHADGGIGCVRLDATRVDCWWWDDVVADHVDAGLEYLGELRGNPRPVPGLSAVQALSLGHRHACALQGDGALKCWGAVGPAPTTSDAQRLPLTRAKALAVSRAHACAIQNHSLLCWGANDHGQLGTRAGPLPPPVANPTLVTELGRVAQVVVGDRHTCARSEGGSVYCFGDPSDGRLGHQHQYHYRRRVKSVEKAVDLTASNDLTCSVNATGKVQCWGLLGGRATQDPQELAELKGASEVSIGLGLVCGRIEERVSCRPSGKRTKTLTPVKQGAVQLVDRCVLTRNQGVKCLAWHRWRDYEDVEHVALRADSVPGLSGVSRLLVAGNLVCGVDDAGQLSCADMPRNYDGENGAEPPTAEDATPSFMRGLGGVVDLDAAGAHLCVAAQGQVWCRGGWNAAGAQSAPAGWRLAPLQAKLP